MRREGVAAVLRQSMLSDREREILRMRMFGDSKLKLREIGQRYGITAERVRQIESNAIRKLAKQLRNESTKKES